MELTNSPEGSLDSIVDNEMLDPNEVSKLLCMEQLLLANGNSKSQFNALKDWKTKLLNLLNVAYDITPSKFINMIITEVGMMPASSVPVIIREYEAATND